MKGFTLVELSIVLVIIGLLIGGILVAQSMVGTTRLQAQIRQLQQIDVIVSNFRTKYNCLPGDCTNISPFGDGDGKIRDNTGGADNLDGEVRGFWAQLYNAGDWKDAYAQFLPGSAIGDPIPAGRNYPKSMLSSQAGIIAVTPNEAVSGSLFIENGQPSSMYIISRHTRRSNVDTDLELSFKVADVVAIDNKIDDGIHYTGDVRAVGRGDGMGVRPANTNECTTHGTSGTYKINSTLEEACILGLRMFSQTGD